MMLTWRSWRHRGCTSAPSHATRHERRDGAALPPPQLTSLEQAPPQACAGWRWHCCILHLGTLLLECGLPSNPLCVAPAHILADVTAGGVIPGLVGGEALLPAAATSAAVEADSGLWLAQLQSGKLPRVCAPGMQCGAFGGWTADVGQVLQEQRALQREMEQGSGATQAALMSQSCSE